MVFSVQGRLRAKWWLSLTMTCLDHLPNLHRRKIQVLSECNGYIEGSLYSSLRQSWFLVSHQRLPPALDTCFNFPSNMRYAHLIGLLPCGCSSAHVHSVNILLNSEHQWWIMTTCPLLNPENGRWETINQVCLALIIQHKLLSLYSVKNFRG